MADFLKGKVAIVTGSGRGIGRGIALHMAYEGAKVVVNDFGGGLRGDGSSESPADEVVSTIKANGGEAIANYDSVATMDGGENIVKTAVDHFGKLDIVVTCAGILRDRMFFNMTEEEWDAVIAVHLKGTFTVVKHACIIFRQQRSGRVITFSSESGLVGNSGQANYGAAKSGIAGFTKVVARDMGRYGVTANSIAPRALTRMTEGLIDDRSNVTQLGIAPGLSGDDLSEDHSAEDVAPFAVYLASDFASGINGQTFLVYGGTIGLMSQPRPVKTIFKDGRWTLDELSDVLPQQLTKNLFNPGPAQPPRK